MLSRAWCWVSLVRVAGDLQEESKMEKITNRKRRRKKNSQPLARRARLVGMHRLRPQWQRNANRRRDACVPSRRGMPTAGETPASPVGDGIPTAGETPASPVGAECQPQARRLRPQSARNANRRRDARAPSAYRPRHCRGIPSKRLRTRYLPALFC